jgi:hypothetical protein
MEWKLRKVKETSPTARENAVEPLLLVYDEPRPLAAPRSAAFRAPMFCRLRMGKLRVYAYGVACLPLALLGVNVPAAVLYVNVNNTTPSPPYTNWASAASTIQDAVDVSAVGDTVRVTNGVYTTGGRAVKARPLVNRVGVDKAIFGKR